MIERFGKNLACPKCSSEDLHRHGSTKKVVCLNNMRRSRFLCQKCKITFSDNYFQMNYRYRHKDQALSSKIFSALIGGMPNRRIAKMLDISEHCVRIRLTRLAQSGLVFQNELVQRHGINEAICYDGLENFSFSQYEPNNINQAIGRDSLFIYDFNYANLNRKGRTSVWQKIRLAEIEAEHGRYNPRAIRITSTRIFKRLLKLNKKERLELLTDEHFQYKRSINKDLKGSPIDQVTVSSKATRNYQNILFSVNHADMMIRHRMKSFTRETIAFAKTAGVMCQKYALFMLHKNFMEPQFTKKHHRRVDADIRSPAEKARLVDRMLGYRDIFGYRAIRQSEIKRLSNDWKCVFNASIPKDQTRQHKFIRQMAS